MIKKISKLFWKYSKNFSRENLYNYLEKTMIKEKIDKKRRVINIGSGGMISRIIKKHIPHILEIDIDVMRSPDIICNIEKLSLKNSSIDVIFCLEVLEHVQNPWIAVREIKRVLKRKGLVVASTPFVFPIHDEPNDYYRYTRYGILHLFKEFKLIELKERNTYIRSIYVLLLRLINAETKKERIKGVLLFPLFIIIFPLIWTLDKIIHSKQSTTGYYYVFSKKENSTTS